jgi:hypothetical protein
MQVYRCVGKNLQIVLIGRFCKFPKKQNRELQYANVRWGKPVRRLQFFSPDKVQKSLIRQNLYLVEVISYQGSPRLNYP